MDTPGVHWTHQVYIGGASAGGLSTFLHADRLADRIRKEGRADCAVIANPVDGYFLDHSDFAHDGRNYTQHMRYMSVNENRARICMCVCDSSFEVCACVFPPGTP